MRTVYVVISCDVDPDRDRLLDGVPPGGLTWRGVTDGIPAVKDAVRGVRDAGGREPVERALRLAVDIEGGQAALDP